MRIPKTSLAFCVIYLLICVGAVVWAQFVSDPKGKYVILQIPVALQHALLSAFDATHILQSGSWFLVYLVFAVPMLVFLAVVGAMIDLVFGRRP